MDITYACGLWVLAYIVPPNHCDSIEFVHGHGRLCHFHTGALLLRMRATVDASLLLVQASESRVKGKLASVRRACGISDGVASMLTDRYTGVYDGQYRWDVLLPKDLAAAVLASRATRFFEHLAARLLEADIIKNDRYARAQDGLSWRHLRGEPAP